MTSDKGFSVGYYCIALIDILSQKEALGRIQKLPENKTEEEEFLEQLRQTFGAVHAYRSTFDSFFKGFSQVRDPSPEMSEEAKELWKRFHNYEIKKQLFSDTMIYYVPMMEHANRLSITGIYGLLGACAGAFLPTLSGGLVGRGGIEVGIAGEFFVGEIYGPALSHVHRLESEIAKYPRIVIGPELVRYIESEWTNPGRTRTDEYRRSMAKECKRWLSLDSDNQVILDYAGSTIQGMIPDSAELIERALEFADHERDRFQTQGNAPLAGRYSLLHDYLISRKRRVSTS